VRFVLKLSGDANSLRIFSGLFRFHGAKTLKTVNPSDHVRSNSNEITSIESKHEACTQERGKGQRVSDEGASFKAFRHPRNQKKFVFVHSSVVLVPVENEDMWHAYNLIAEGDQVKASTIRKVSRTDESRERW
jgi:hypothetical protein